MDKREKVIKGLECCSRGIIDDCENCPYVHDGMTCDVAMMRDALELLKQEPRVLTLEEYKEIAERPRNKRIPVWMEWIDWNCSWTIPQRVYEMYGVTWRCWTGVPTNERRMSEKWQDT